MEKPGLNLLKSFVNSLLCNVSLICFSSTSKVNGTVYPNCVNVPLRYYSLILSLMHCHTRECAVNLNKLLRVWLPRCSKCPAEFTRQKSYLLHQRNVHHCDRNFQCETCGRAFLFETNLLRHQQVHTSV